MTEPSVPVANRVLSRVAVWKGEDIDDPFKTVAITREIEDYGFEVPCGA